MQDSLPYLTGLKVIGQTITLTAIRHLGIALKSNSVLQQLGITSSPSFPGEALQILSMSLSHVKILDLSDNALDSSHIQALCALPSLESLCLNGNQLTEGLDLILQSNPTLSVLLANHNPLSSRGLLDCFEALHQDHSLKRLELEAVPADDKAVRTLAKVLRTCSLEDLKIDLSQASKSALEELEITVTRFNQSLKTLNSRNTDWASLQAKNGLKNIQKALLANQWLKDSTHFTQEQFNEIAAIVEFKMSQGLAHSPQKKTEEFEEELFLEQEYSVVQQKEIIKTDSETQTELTGKQIEELTSKLTSLKSEFDSKLELLQTQLSHIEQNQPPDHSEYLKILSEKLNLLEKKNPPNFSEDIAKLSNSLKKLSSRLEVTECSLNIKSSGTVPVKELQKIRESQATIHIHLQKLTSESFKAQGDLSKLEKSFAQHLHNTELVEQIEALETRVHSLEQSSADSTHRFQQELSALASQSERLSHERTQFQGLETRLSQLESSVEQQRLALTHFDSTKQTLSNLEAQLSEVSEKVNTPARILSASQVIYPRKMPEEVLLPGKTESLVMEALVERARANKKPTQLIARPLQLPEEGPSIQLRESLRQKGIKYPMPSRHSPTHFTSY